MTVHKVAPFLARRVADGARVLLVVLDGVGFAQWEILLDKTGIRPLQQGACLAMLPTETTVSRQALLAGTTPDDFAPSFHTTAKEEQQWRAFWAREGVSDRDVRYYRVDGLRTDTVPLSSVHRAVAVIISAVDKMMHRSALLGDAQLTAGWPHGANRATCPTCSPGRASRASRHGLLRTTVTLSPPPAALHRRVSRSSDQVREYGYTGVPPCATPQLRWGSLGLLRACLRIFMCSSRRDAKGFSARGLRVTHGGLSFEEVFVPLARLT